MSRAFENAKVERVRRYDKGGYAALPPKDYDAKH